VAMSATFRANDQLALSKLLQVTPTHLSWGAMQRRNLEFAVTVQADVYGPMFQGVKMVLERDLDSKVLLYTNTRATAEDVLLKKSEKLLLSTTGGGDAIPLTGGTGLMMKNWIVNLFGGDLKSDAANVRIVLATSAANCGLSSIYCRHAPRMGMPPNLYDLMQEMGRLNRDDQAREPPDKYHLFVSFTLFMGLYLRIMKAKQQSERDIQLGELMDVLRFLLLPHNCYHLTLKSYFGHPSLAQPRLPCGRLFSCGNRCTYCRKDHHQFSTPFHKGKLVHYLSTKVFLQGPTGVAKMIKLLGENKKVYFPTGFSSLPQGKIHGLVLQLIAAGIVSLGIAPLSSSKVGTDRLSSSDVELNWATTDVGGETVLAHEQAHRWSMMNTIPNI
jgi:superfamily II DNA helicase RecQ